jgi:hypothetical protein
MEHKFHLCKRTSCMVCNGGLSLCTICGGAEGSLTTDCPGKQLTGKEQDKIYAGSLDFRDGSWVSAPNPTNQRWRQARSYLETKS